MNIWDVLAIEPTRDVAAIKKAYAGQLRKNHPDKNPAGFQQVRSAYLDALAHVELGDSLAKIEYPEPNTQLHGADFVAAEKSKPIDLVEQELGFEWNADFADVQKELVETFDQPELSEERLRRLLGHVAFDDLDFNREMALEAFRLLLQRGGGRWTQHHRTPDWATRLLNDCFQWVNRLELLEERFSPFTIDVTLRVLEDYQALKKVRRLARKDQPLTYIPSPATRAASFVADFAMASFSAAALLAWLNGYVSDSVQIGLFFGSLYLWFTGFESSPLRATPIRFFWGMRISTKAGLRPPFYQVACRTAMLPIYFSGFLISGLVGMVVLIGGLLWGLSTHRYLHDYVAGTTVLRRES